MGEVDRFQEMLKEKLKELEASITQRYERVTQRVKDHIESEVRNIIEKMLK